MNPQVELIPAATLILLRERIDGTPEILMVERAAKMAFAAGALVFPGGRVDPADRALAAADTLLGGAEGLDPEERAARIAAIRETVEEVGLAVGLHPQPEAHAVERLRAGLADGAELGAMLMSQGYRVDLAQLAPFAWWRPTHRPHRNFDTRFYVARAPAAKWRADGHETVHAAWQSAAEVLAGHAAGSCHIIFPTLCILQRLAQFGSIDAICADAAAYPIGPLTPRYELREGVLYGILPEGLGYPFAVQAVDAPN